MSMTAAISTQRDGARSITKRLDYLKRGEPLGIA
jgi:hypothetical protein